MIERPGSGDAAVLVSLDFGDTDYEESLEELQRLTESAGVGILGIVRGKRYRPEIGRASCRERVCQYV